MYTVYSKHHKLHATDNIFADGQRFECKEVPARAEVIASAIRKTPLGPCITPNDYGLTPIRAVHAPDYLAYLQTAYHLNYEQTGESVLLLLTRSEVTPQRATQQPAVFEAQREYYTYDYEDPILAGTWEAAYWSAQCALTAADLVQGGEAIAYALCRPPGHHATMDQYGGFCYLNNIAIAARYLQQGAERIAILDLDYHHGNGTQAIFYEDPAVLFCSLHADPHLDYPFYWGYASERGTGAGMYTNYNWPLPLKCDDAHYLQALDEALNVIVNFNPHYLLISLGLDAVMGDPIGKFNFTSAGLSTVGERIATLRLPTVVVQEGGYNLETLGVNIVTFFRALEQNIPRSPRPIA
ncbi:MAG: histone deacetylase family protein [Anaerolineae bacterium]|nr:histone deacetylase family protein [Anaerolineae bacterium]